MTRPNVNVTIGGPQNDNQAIYKTVVLRENIPFSSQVGNPNTRYVIKWAFNLGGAEKKSIVIPSNQTAQWLNPKYILIYNTISEMNEDLDKMREDLEKATDPVEIARLTDNILGWEDSIAAKEEILNNTPQFVTYYYAKAHVKAGEAIYLYDQKTEFISITTQTEDTTTHIIAEEDTDVYIASSTPHRSSYTLMPYVKLPEGCILDFQGGYVYGGCIVGDKSLIVAQEEETIFNTLVDDTQISGVWLNKYATPNWFGAKGDKVNDDTVALQRACDSGLDVFLPQTGIYKIPNTIYITKSYQTIHGTIKNSKSSNATFYPGSEIYYCPENVDDILFCIVDNVHDIHFSNILIRGNQNGTFIDCSGNYCDKDISVEDCFMTGANLVINFKGRGCTVKDSLIHGNHFFVGNWDDEYQSGPHPAENGQRAYWFQNNRFHDYRGLLIYIESGHARGLVFKDNLIDLGRRRVIECNDLAENWHISNNTIQGLFAGDHTFVFNGGITGCVISNNIVEGKRNEWLSRVTTDYSKVFTMAIIYVKCENSVINGNVLNGLLWTGVCFIADVYNTEITNNVCCKIGRNSNKTTVRNNCQFIYFDIIRDPDTRVPILENINISNNIVNFEITEYEYVKRMISFAASVTFVNSIISDNIVTGENEIFNSDIKISYDNKCRLFIPSMAKGLYEDKPSKNIPLGYEYYATDLKKNVYVGELNGNKEVTSWVDAVGEEIVE